MSKVTDIAYVVATTPRSGTGYAASLLSSLGLNCGHEKSFNPGPCNYRKAFPIWGDASWLSIPFLKNLPSTTLVLHQIRNPVKTLDSMMARRQLRGRFKPEHKIPRGPYTNFLKKNTNGGWESCDAEDRLVKFWIEWHTRIEADILACGLQHFRYRIEDVDESLLHTIAEKLGVEFSSKQIAKALTTPTVVNHRLGPANTVVPWSEKYLSSHDSEAVEKLVSMSKGYGYA